MTRTLSTRGETEDVATWELMASHRVFVATIVLAFTGLAATAAFLTTPVYRATVVLLPAESKTSMAATLGAALGGLESLGSLVGLGIGDSQNTVEAVALLKSRDFTETFIRDHNLLQRLYMTQWDQQRHAWRTSRWSSAEPTLYAAFRKFDRQIRHISEDKTTGLVTLEVDWIDPAEGAEWANDLVRQVNDVMRKRALDEADASISLLTDELKTAPTVELRDAISRTIETHVKARALAKVRADYAFRVIDPAKPAGPRDYVRPQRVLYLIGGPVLGFMLAVLLVLTRDFVRRQRARR